MFMSYLFEEYPNMLHTSMIYPQESDNLTPRKLQRTPISHTPGNPPATQTMKGIPAYSLLVKVARGVFQGCVETTLD